MITITDKKRCRYIRLSASLFVACLLWGCSNDDSVVSPQQVNVNRNTATVQTFYTEPTTPASVKTSVVYGLEIPSLKTDMVDAFIAHTLPNGTLNYCIGYNTRLKANCWTAYKWYNGFSAIRNMNNNWSRDNWLKGETFNGYGGNGDPFQPDPVLPDAVRIRQDEYSSSGYQRGHMLGSADRLNSKEANGQTFYMSNIHPQLKGFNEKPSVWWNLENTLRDSYDKEDFRDILYVVKGGTISAGKYKMVGRNNNLVCPSYFYVAILAYRKKYKLNSGYFAIAFWMEHKANSDKVSAKYAITIDELEKRTGIDFFCNLPDEIEDAVENRYYLSDWRLN